MKKILLLNLFCALLFGVQTANARYVQLYEGNFPDPIFRDYVSQLTHVAVLDFISEEQLNAVDKIDVHNKGISSLKGIEFFEKLAILNCSGNNITTLSFYGNRLLQLIDCSGNNLTSIDVSMLPLLREFECSANKLSQIILPSNSILNRLGCDYNKLSSLDLSMQSNLLVLTCTYNLLTSLDVSKSSKLQTLYCNNNKLTSLLTQSPDLSVIICENNNLSSLNTSTLPKLRELSCNFNPNLKELDISKNTKLETLYARECGLIEIDLSNNSELKILNVQDNDLLALFLENNPNLVELLCDNNLLSRLDLSMINHLDVLGVSGNRLVAINGLNRAMGVTSGSLGPQASTRRFNRVAYNSSEENAWGIYLWANDVSAANFSNFKMDGERVTPILYKGYLIVSTDLKKIPKKIEYDFITCDAGSMHVSVDYDVVNYGIIINGKEMTSLDMNRVPGIVSGKAYLNDGAGWGTLGWANEPTLVLDNATLEYNNTNESYAFHNSACFNFTIKVIGDCYIISNTGATLYPDIATNTYINGGGTLNVVNINGGLAIELNDYSDLFIQEGTTLIADSYKGYGLYDVSGGKLDIGSGCTFCAHSANVAPLGSIGKLVLADDIALRYPVGAYLQNGDYYYADGTYLKKDWIVFGPEGATHPEESIAVGISPLKETKEWTSIYNLSGQRLNKMQRGINIVNGKKIIRN